jgi:hypothetical protein
MFEFLNTIWRSLNKTVGFYEIGVDVGTAMLLEKKISITNEIGARIKTADPKAVKAYNAMMLAHEQKLKANK